MRGHVDGSAREPVLALRVLGGSGSQAEVDAVVDTGFTGTLYLPPDLVRTLSLPLVGSAVETRVHRARVVWHGLERVLATEGGPLVGMAPLRGSRLTVDAVPGGEALVEELHRKVVSTSVALGGEARPQNRGQFLTLARVRRRST